MENMQQMHQKQMEEMNSAIENLKEQHGELQSEIEKKNEFISLPIRKQTIVTRELFGHSL